MGQYRMTQSTTMVFTIDLETFKRAAVLCSILKTKEESTIDIKPAICIKYCAFKPIKQGLESTILLILFW